MEEENCDLKKDNQLDEALYKCHQAKMLEAEAVSALRELQVGLQANLSKDAVSNKQISSRAFTSSNF